MEKKNSCKMQFKLTKNLRVTSNFFFVISIKILPIFPHCTHRYKRQVARVRGYYVKEYIAIYSFFLFFSPGKRPVSYCRGVDRY